MFAGRRIVQVEIVILSPIQVNHVSEFFSVRRPVGSEFGAFP